MSDPTPSERSGETGEPSAPEGVRIRRAPKLGVFIGLGAALGILASLILTSLFPVDEKIGFAASFGYFALYGVTIGVLLGALVGLVLDAVSSRRARNAVVERQIVDAPADPDPSVEPAETPIDPEDDPR